MKVAINSAVWTGFQLIASCPPPFVRARRLHTSKTEYQRLVTITVSCLNTATAVNQEENQTTSSVWCTDAPTAANT